MQVYVVQRGREQARMYYATIGDEHNQWKLNMTECRSKSPHVSWQVEQSRRQSDESFQLERTLLLQLKIYARHARTRAAGSRNNDVRHVVGTQNPGELTMQFCCELSLASRATSNLP